MSYDIRFKAKLEGIDRYISVGYCDANITYNVRDIILHSTGLAWENEANNGLCKYVIPYIKSGLWELRRNGANYKQYEDQDGWGTVRGTIQFFEKILCDWNDLKEDDPELAEIVTFWIE